jgi:hypothetical protein
MSILDADSTSASGPYAIDPDGSGGDAPFTVYCDQTNHGGGWTLVGSFLDTMFNATTMGSASDPCYDAACVNRAYALLPLGSDVRIDAAEEAISGESMGATALFLGIDAATVGRTLRSVFTAGMPAYVEGPTTTVSVEWFNDLGCGTWGNYGGGLCEAGIHVVFAIPSGCPPGPIFALGVSNSFDGNSTFCDGWPQQPTSNFPKAIRVWTR